MISCEENGVSESAATIQYHRSAQLTNIYNNEISVLTKAFINETELLQQSAITFQQSTTSENLDATIALWKSSQSLWKQLELYDVGAIENTFISSEINFWPTNEIFINDNISGTATINEALITSLGASSKGISAIEYLLFSGDENTQILNSFTTSENAERRKQYLTGLTQNLSAKSKELNDHWENYEEDFTSSLENGISGTQNQMINAMITLIEEIIITKLGNPLGDTNGGIIEAERLEGYYSEFSKEIIEQHVISLERCYLGDFSQTPFRIGFDDFLILSGREILANQISDQFAVCKEELASISGSLEDEIIKNPDAVNDLKDTFRDLLVLVKVDMANILGSTITFNDNDGD
ncbi:hypothetical protein GCM10022393_18330 [Aquimarina addita]|uniref:Imelysin-like domain-containing protein n=1 Tax=Aquimarina addita TaxID=870485 RepID=A0ABP6UH92_9FLAO